VYEDKDGGDWEENENGEGRHDIEIRGLDKLHELEGLRGLRGMTMNLGRPRLGITMEDASGGVRITDVLDDTPAARAGLREGDVIVRVGDDAIGDTEDLGRAVRNAPAGPLSIEVRRNGTRRTLEANLGPARDGDDVRRQIERELRVPGNGKTRVYRFEAPTPTPERGAMRWRPRDSDELRREIADLRRRLEQLERQLEAQGDDR